MSANKDSQLVTKKMLEKTLDKAFEKHTKVILKAVDFSICGLKKDVGGLKKDVASLKTDVSSLKTDVGILKTDMVIIKNDVSDLKNKFVKLEKNDKKILTWQDRISKQLTELKQESKMDTASYKRHDEKIEGHEERISNLELKIQPAELTRS